MIPHRGAEFGGAGDPELRAAPQGNGMVIEHGGHDEGAVEDGSHKNGVLELGELVAEAAVGGVPEESLSGEVRGSAGAALLGSSV